MSPDVGSSLLDIRYAQFIVLVPAKLVSLGECKHSRLYENYPGITDEVQCRNSSPDTIKMFAISLILLVKHTVFRSMADRCVMVFMLNSLRFHLDVS